MRLRRTALFVSAILAGGMSVLLLAGPAEAHVTVSAPGVAVGATDATITFRVPTESDTASTTGLRLQLPTATPLVGVLVAPLPGWTATIKNTKLSTPIKTDDGDISEVVSEIDWKASAGAGIAPGFFGQFTIIAGQLPEKASTLTFKAIQTYSDGSTVSWIEEPAPGSTAEPEHPAPVLTLGPAATSSTGVSPVPAGSASTSPAATPPTASSSGASKAAAKTGIVLGGLGVLLGAGALALALRRGVRAP